LLHDFWDPTNQRYTSGILVTTFNSFTWSGSAVSGETAKVRMSPVNYQQDANDQVILNNVDLAGPSVSPSYSHATAINYGMPDSSAVLNSDGTISLVNFEFEIESNAFTPIASNISVEISYTTTFTEYSPYGSTGGTLYTSALYIGPGSAAGWGMIAENGPGAGNYAYVVQLKTLTWSVLPGTDPTGMVPQFQLSNPARRGGAVVANYNSSLTPAYGSSLTFFDHYTYVFAVNNGKVDANATPVESSGVQLLNLCNFGLTAADASGTHTATATLTYTIATHSL
jgi:hypothetical protein